MSAPRRAVYPGSFNPPTVAHLRIAELVIAECNVDHVTFVLSRVALAKEDVVRPLLTDRIEIVRKSLEAYPAFDLEVTDHQLLADIAAGFDVVIMGADKWHQIRDPAFYDNSPRLRDAAMERLPEVALLPRPPFEVPSDVTTLQLGAAVAATLGGVSSSLARNGQRELMTPAAEAFDIETGAWTEPDRYERYLVSAATEGSRE